ncbi:hypothetical protein FPZ24_07085 [Sphingomonas panacisoli]|uniref:Uncharacterized protein n=1 Tax=Sphingomonas panacisoli TaxID=1813879 RepID=A0A5B8LJG5_9SPHN|nr:hypothetical protein [Sphingomonas panacisoli]QDZ07270.1 hypothetical protein FPZ24_07085 [Sphingomonas panacisoli]
MDVTTVLARASSGLGKHTVYKSPGHMPHFAATSFPDHGELDCSGFVYWCIRFASNPPESRMVDHPLYKKINGGWFETTAIHADGLTGTGYFHKVEPVVGAFLVYPDYRGADGKRHDGHIGIITEIDPTKTGIARVTKIIHCSLGGWTQQHDAIQETGPDHWLKQASSIAVWYEGMDGAPTALSAEAAGSASAAGAAETHAVPNYRSLTGGFFSKDPYDLKQRRSIRTNNPGALNVTGWQRVFPGFVGVTAPDHAENVTSIYVTPEHGVGAWHYLMTGRYGYGEQGKVELQDLARRYAGVASASDPAAQSYVKGWTKWASSLTATSVLDLSDDADMLNLAHGMFGHEAGQKTPLKDDQILTALKMKRTGTLPPA